MSNTLKEALTKLADEPAASIVARLKTISQEQDQLFADLNKLIPLEHGYVWGQAINGIVRPWRICDDSNYSDG